MKLSDFDLDLPQELIAQIPSEKRDHSNLLIPSANSNKIVKFFEILDYIRKGDLLVFNDSRVINAKLTLTKESKAINVNLNKPSGTNAWMGFAKPAKKLQEGDEFSFGRYKLIIKKKIEAGEIEIEFQLDK